MEYTATNGWRLALFNDGNEWDYLEWIEAPDGRRVHDDQLGESSDLVNDAPGPSVAWDRDGMPGNRTFRCLRCGTALESPHDEVFLCGTCREATA